MIKKLLNDKIAIGCILIIMISCKYGSFGANCGANIPKIQVIIIIRIHPIAILSFKSFFIIFPPLFLSLDQLNIEPWFVQYY